MKVFLAVAVAALATAGGTLASTERTTTKPSPAVARSCANAIIKGRLTISAAGFAMASASLDVEHLAQAVTDASQGDVNSALAQEQSVDVQGLTQQLRYFEGTEKGSAMSAFNSAAAACWRWASSSA